MKFYIGGTILTLILSGVFVVPTPVSAASEITCNSAVLSAWVDPQGSPTTAWIQWGTSSSLSGTTFSSTPQTYNNYQTFSVTATNLSENTTYYYRGRFQNASRGSWNGDILSFRTEDCGDTSPTDCSDITANLSGRITSTGSPATATIRNNSNCTYTVSFASYEQYSTGADWISSQKLFNSSTKTVGPNATVNFSVAVPSCHYQLDLVEGYPLTPPDYGSSGPGHYLFDAEFGGGALCGTVTPNTPPKGYLDEATCSVIKGWAFDDDNPDATVTVELSDGNRTVRTQADTNRQDVGAIYPKAGDWHGFSISTPSVFKDTFSHTIRAYALDLTTGNRTQLGTSPKTIPACEVPPPPPQTCQDPSAINFGGPLPCRYKNFPSVNLTADNTNLPFGGSTTLRWSVSNAVSCSASNGWSGGKNANSGSEGTGSLNSSRTYVLTCFSSTGQSANDSVTVNVGSQTLLPNVDITASRTNINSGETTTLVWTVQNATTCTASGDWSGNVSPSGNSQAVGPLFSNKTYNLTCFNNSGNSDADSITIFVGNTGQGPDVTTRSATSIDRDEATLRGEVNGNGLSTRVWFEWSRDRDEVEDGDGEETDEIFTGTGTDDFDKNIDGLRDDTTYYFRAVARNSAGTDFGNILSFRTDDDDDDNGDRPSVTIYANPSNVNYGSAGSVTWSSSDADTCRASGGVNNWSGSQNRSGTFYTGALFNNTTFRITCENDEGTDSDSVTINVGGVIAPQTLPTVILYAGQTSLPYNGATTIYWSTVGATTCQASGGSTGWTGPKSIGPGSFYTGSLSASRTYTITCSNNVGSDTDSVTVSVRPPTTGGPTPPPPTSLVLVTSSVDRTQPIIPTLDNTKPCPGDEINYTITYQNIGTGSVRSLVLRLDLPFEVSYMFSNPNNPAIAGNSLTFSLGTLGANSQGTITVRVRVRDDAPIGANLNFPAILSYIDPAGIAQTVTANVAAQVWCEPLAPVQLESRTDLQLGATVFGAGFWPDTLFEWLLLLILILLLILLIRYLIVGTMGASPRRTTTTTVEH